MGTGPLCDGGVATKRQMLAIESAALPLFATKR